MLGFRMFASKVVAWAVAVLMCSAACSAIEPKCKNGTCPNQRVAQATANVVQATANVVHGTAHAAYEIVSPPYGQFVTKQVYPSSDYVPQAPQPIGKSCCCQPVNQCSQPSVSSGGLAQAKAAKQAERGRMHHVGGGLGGGSYEGVGFSTSGPDEAIKASCYWGQKNPIDIGVSCTKRGCYATVIYQ